MTCIFAGKPSRLPVRASLIVEHRIITNGNKRLAVVGDQVIALILSEDWFTSGADKGELFDMPVSICH